MSRRKPPAREARIRRARARDLDALLAIERAAFQPERQSSARVLRRSLGSAHQSVWVIDARPGGLCPLAALLVLWHRPRTVRVFDIAVHPAHRGEGLARRLMTHAEGLAARASARRVVLEASVDEPGLVPMYEHLGYAVVARRRGFYGPGRDAVRMTKSLVARDP